MIYMRVYARAISERLRLMGLHNRWYIKTSLEDLKDYIEMIFEVEGQESVTCSFTIDRGHTLSVVPRLSYDMGNKVMHFLYMRNVGDTDAN